MTSVDSVLLTVPMYERAVERLAQFADDPADARATADADLLDRLLAGLESGGLVTKEILQAGLVLAEVERANDKADVIVAWAGRFGVGLTPVHG